MTQMELGFSLVLRKLWIDIEALHTYSKVYHAAGEIGSYPITEPLWTESPEVQTRTKSPIVLMENLL